MEEALLRGFEFFFGIGGQVWDQNRFVRVLGDLRSFWARNDRPILDTVTNEKPLQINHLRVIRILEQGHRVSRA